MIKRVMTCLYAHKTNVLELVSAIKEKEWRERVLICLNEYKYPFEVLKYDKSKHTLSFIQSPDWNVANEPIVGDSRVFDLTSGVHLFEMSSKLVKMCKNPKIYHNKWQFVADNYKGFDITLSKQRTALWNSVPEICANKNKIGNRDYWYMLLDKYHIPK